ncbi:MAG: tRNA (N(6)-L-threonylcarbamoyladenosine(37)-C(2))-methylthiotransferase MtaB [Chloroflexi bacterium]|nr:tRNA (N(6)-L-threonylcarbamoyladenosine(37)-C(2))-methylthiotransferase MtaB [Chloroflexota bacterium]
METAGPKVAVATLGCKVNQAESEAMMREFVDAGFGVASFDGPADVYILNSCTVTHIADRKSRQLVRQARRNNPEAVVVLAGCYAEVDGDRIASTIGANLVVGNSQKSEVVALVEAQLGRHAATAGEPLAIPSRPADLTARTRAMVKVQDGCNNFCSYCIVPHARGRERSVPPDDVLAEVRSRVRSGYKEVVLTGVHAGAYGKGEPGGPTLATLVRRILEETAVLRLRLSSIEPWDVDRELLALLGPSGEGRFCRHLHLPLQSGSDGVLRRMRRRYTTRQFAVLVDRVRSIDPDVAITTDVIAGFPGETDAEFAEGLRFCREMGFARTHVFRYSPRKGTSAATLAEQVGERRKRERSEEIAAVGQASAKQFRRRFIGQRLVVLWEHAGRLAGQPVQVWTGLTDNYLRVDTACEEDLGNRLLPAHIVEERSDSLWSGFPS